MNGTSTPILALVAENEINRARIRMKAVAEESAVKTEENFPTH